MRLLGSQRLHPNYSNQIFNKTPITHIKGFHAPCEIALLWYFSTAKREIFKWLCIRYMYENEA